MEFHIWNIELLSAISKEKAFLHQNFSVSRCSFCIHWSEGKYFTIPSIWIYTFFRNLLLFLLFFAFLACFFFTFFFYFFGIWCRAAAIILNLASCFVISLTSLSSTERENTLLHVSPYTRGRIFPHAVCTMYHDSLCDAFIICCSAASIGINSYY